jgi:hypothetical protein
MQFESRPAEFSEGNLKPLLTSENLNPPAKLYAVTYHRWCTSSLALKGPSHTDVQRKVG